jgi:hypothetical protein
LLSGCILNSANASETKMDIEVEQNISNKKLGLSKQNIEEIEKSIPNIPFGSKIEQMVMEGINLNGQENSFFQAIGDEQNPAQIWWQNKYIQADEIYYDFVKDTATAKNNVILKNDQVIIVAPKASYTFDAQKGEVKDAKYKFTKNVAYGTADIVNLEKYSVNLKNGTYTTCELIFQLVCSCHLLLNEICLNGLLLVASVFWRYL